MQDSRKLGGSLLFAILSFLLVLGGLSTTLAEKRINEPPPTITETSVPARVIKTFIFPPPTLAASDLLPSATISPSPSATATIPPSTNCPAPSGWVAYFVQVGDTVDGIAARYGIFSKTLQEANCLIGNSLIPDTRIYVPFTPTATYIPCGAPYGWVFYTVKTGDNLYRISLAYRITTAQLQNANCLGNSTQITVGQKLYVPNLPTSTPAVTNTPTNTSTPTTTNTPLSTLTAPPATLTNTATTIPPTITSTVTETLIPPTITPTATETLIPPTETPTPTNTATETSPPSPTPTLTP